MVQISSMNTFLTHAFFGGHCVDQLEIIKQNY